MGPQAALIDDSLRRAAEYDDKVLFKRGARSVTHACMKLRAGHDEIKNKIVEMKFESLKATNARTESGNVRSPALNAAACVVILPEFPKANTRVPKTRKNKLYKNAEFLAAGKKRLAERIIEAKARLVKNKRKRKMNKVARDWLPSGVPPCPPSFM
eukprot:3724618-Pleurochrysis_carterae.AAC.1